MERKESLVEVLKNFDEVEKEAKKQGIEKSFKETQKIFIEIEAYENRSLTERIMLGTQIESQVIVATNHKKGFGIFKLWKKDKKHESWIDELNRLTGIDKRYSKSGWVNSPGPLLGGILIAFLVVVCFTFMNLFLRELEMEIPNPVWIIEFVITPILIFIFSFLAILATRSFLDKRMADAKYLDKKIEELFEN